MASEIRAGNQHVEIGKLRCSVENGLRQQDHDGDRGDLAATVAAGEQVHAAGGKCGGEQRCHSRRQLMTAEKTQAQAGQPIEQRWFVEKRQAVESGNQPVAGSQHFPRDPDITPLVGEHQRADSGRRRQPHGGRDDDQQRRPGVDQPRKQACSGRAHKRFLKTCRQATSAACSA
jgi:hypothetical protein